MSIAHLWRKNAIIYCLDVEKYQDANDDGVGDSKGDVCFDTPSCRSVLVTTAERDDLPVRVWAGRQDNKCGPVSE